MSEIKQNEKGNVIAPPVISGNGLVTKLFIALLAVLFILIVWGAYVRLTGSGLSIPEWPIVNGSLLPPTSDSDWQTVYQKYYLEVFNVTDLSASNVIPIEDFKRMFAIEYIHRFIAAISGILFIILLWLSLKSKALRQRLGVLMVASLVLLFIQILLGGIVVKEELKPELIAAHLAAGYIFFLAMLWAYLTLTDRINNRGTICSSKFGMFSFIAAAALFLQIISGGLMAGSGAGHILNTYPKMGSEWLPSGSALFADTYGGFWNNLTRNPILIQVIHRWWILVVIAGIGLQHAFKREIELTGRGRLAFLVSSILLIVQIVWGIGNLMMKVPVYMSAGHSAIALLFFASLVIVAFESRQWEQD
jgi:cytochrome c oxidase assembly protein subunit 15